MLIDKPKLWSNEWFEIWQWLLLIAINSPIKGLREEVRHRLGINLDRQILIDRLLRNSFCIHTGENEYQETFYGKNVFAKSVHCELMWLWEIIHKWDMNFANYISPKLNFGFDTLTKYPDPDPETNTVDGYVGYRPSETSWAVIRAGAGDICDDSHGAGTAISFTVGSAQYLYEALYRAILLFDTSALTNLAIITATTLSTYSLGSLPFGLVLSTPASNTGLINSDFASLGSTLQSDSYVSGGDGSYGEALITLNSTGRGNISKTSITKLGFRCQADIDNSAPSDNPGTTVSTYIRYSENGGATIPKLTITYSLPSGNPNQMII